MDPVTFHDYCAIIIILYYAPHFGVTAIHALSGNMGLWIIKDGVRWSCWRQPQGTVQFFLTKQDIFFSAFWYCRSDDPITSSCDDIALQESSVCLFYTVFGRRKYFIAHHSHLHLILMSLSEQSVAYPCITSQSWFSALNSINLYQSSKEHESLSYVLCMWKEIRALSFNISYTLKLMKGAFGQRGCLTSKWQINYYFFLN